MFAHRLVSAGIGGKTVDELNDTMTVDEFVRWQAYDSISPINRFDDWFAALEYYMIKVAGVKSPPSVDSLKLGKMPHIPLTAEQLETKVKHLFNSSETNRE